MVWAFWWFNKLPAWRYERPHWAQRKGRSSPSATVDFTPCPSLALSVFSPGARGGSVGAFWAFP